MNSVPRLFGIAVVGSMSGMRAQFVKGNEAVKLLADGNRVVKTLRLPKAGLAGMPRPCRSDEECHPSHWRSVETADGLLECTEVYARPGSCRASTYGAQNRSPLRVAKVSGTWLQRRYPDVYSNCVPIFARPPANLPYDAVL